MKIGKKSFPVEFQRDLLTGSIEIRGEMNHGDGRIDVTNPGFMCFVH
jgi:hypothetical protein